MTKKVYVKPPHPEARVLRVSSAVFIAPSGMPIRIDAELVPAFEAAGWLVVGPSARVTLRVRQGGKPAKPSGDDTAD